MPTSSKLEIENKRKKASGGGRKSKDATTTGSGSSFALSNAQSESTRFRLTSNAGISSNHIVNVQSGGSDGTQFLIFDAEL